MTLADHLADVRERLLRNEYPNEAAISGGIVRRVLDTLGWPVYDPHVVFPEFSVKGRRVDFALCHPAGKPRVFVEVKQPGQARGADQQLFEYAFHEGVPMAVMTDGREWHVYVPAGAGSYDERRVYLLDLTERAPEEAADRLRRYLAYDRVRTEDAIRAARDDYDRLAKNREGERHLPDAWKRLMEEADPALVTLLGEKVEALCGVRPDDAKVTAFLQKQTIASGISLKPTAKPSVPPAPTSPTRQRSVSSSTDHTSQQETTSWFILEGERFEHKTAAEVYREFFRRLLTKHPGFAERFSRDSRERARGFLSRDFSELLPNQPDKWQIGSYVAQMPSGWLLMTHMNNRFKASKAREAGEAAGLRYGTDFSIHLPTSR